MLKKQMQRSMLAHNSAPFSQLLPIQQRGRFGKTREAGSRMSSGVWNFGFVVIVGEKFATLIHRFEKFNRALEPGVNFKIPFIDKIAYVHDLREQVVEISSQVAVTQDNVALHIDGVLFVEVVDPHAASYQVEDFQSAITNLAQTTMRSEIGKLTLDKMFVERSTLN